MKNDIERHYEIVISDDIKEKYIEDLSSIENTLNNPNSFIKISKIIAEKHLGILIKNSFSEISHDNGFVIIRNLPVDPKLPSTPTDGQRPIAKTTISESVLLGIVSAVGYKPYSFLQEKNGAIVHEIAPVSGSGSSISSNGVVDFDYHTDGAYLNRYVRPHILSLFCLRNDSKTATKLCRLGKIIELLDPEDLFELMQSNYIHYPPETFLDDKEIKAPILNKVDDRIEITVSTHNVKALTDKADKALLSLRSIARSNYTEIDWGPGDMVIFNNLRCLHARGEIKGDRWLQRCYGNVDKNMTDIVDLNKNNIATQTGS